MNKIYNLILLIILVVSLVGLTSGCSSSITTTSQPSLSTQQTLPTQVQSTTQLQSLSTTFAKTTNISSSPKIDKWDWIVPDDYSTLMDAVQVAKDGDVIRLRGGKISVGSGDIENRNLTIVGDGSDVTTLDKELGIISSNVTLEYLSGTSTTFTNSNISVASVVFDSITLKNTLNFQADNIESNQFSYQYVGSIPRTGPGSITLKNSTIGNMSVGVENSVTNIIIDHCTLGRTPKIYSGNLSITGALINITHNDIFSVFQISGLGHGLSYNTFENTSGLTINGTSGNVSDNNILCDRKSITDNDESTVWQSNYWAGWNSTKPVPISGTAKSVDRSPSLQPIPGN